MIRSPLPGMPPWHCVSHQTCAQQRRIHQMDNRNGRYRNRKALSLHQQPEKTGVREFRWPHRPSHTIVAAIEDGSMDQFVEEATTLAAGNTGILVDGEIVAG